jgi:trk system potassium uptake protein TrkH
MKLINPLIIIRILSTIMIIEAVSFIFCIPVALIYGEVLYPFLLSILICLITWLVFRLISRKAKTSEISNRDGYLAVTLSWIFFCLAGALPYILSGTIPSLVDAFFESASGFTTTGASILSDVESLPFSILFWRSLTHWIGGIGIIVLVIIILPSIGISAQQLFSLESSLKEKIHPKTKSIGIRILMIYLGLTLSEIVLLSIGEMNLFESICHTFGTVATGGFSTRNTSLVTFSPYSQYIITVYMFLAGISYVVYYYIIKFQFTKAKQNSELAFYTALVVITGLILSGILFLRAGKPIEESLREGFFQVLSSVTTTGYANGDYISWPSSAIAIVFLLLFAGACTGSSTGSIKMVRHLIVLKNIKHMFTRLQHPSAVMQIRLNGKLLNDRTNRNILSFVALYLFLFLIGSMLLTIAGNDAITAASASATALGNVGPGLGSVGPMSNYSHFSNGAKLIFSSLMITGRLEIFTVFVLFSKSYWKV